jgi:5-methylcytosine-specific restriction endonuclease McrA
MDIIDIVRGLTVIIMRSLGRWRLMMVSEEYKQYLRSKHWRERRKEFLEEENYVCEDCGGVASQVHHLNYDCLYEEERDDVAVLCKECHVDRELEKGTDLEGDDDYGTW